MRSLGDYQSITYLPQIHTPHQNSRHQNGDKKQVPYRQPTRIRRHVAKLSRPCDMTHGSFTPLDIILCYIILYYIISCHIISYISYHISYSDKLIFSYLQSFLLLISNFRRVPNVVRFLLGNSPASEFYMLTFRNTVSVPNSWAGRYLTAHEDGTDSVPKRRHIKFRRRRITQKKTKNEFFCYCCGSEM